MPDVDIQIVGENGPVGGPSESIGIDFGALKARAAEYLEKSEQQQAATPVVPTVAQPAEASDPTKVRVKGATTGQQAKVEQPVETGQPAAAPVEEAEESAKAALAIGDDDLVEVTVDGESMVLPWKEARGKISGGLKFTQNMQKLAQERETFQTERNAVLQLQRERQNLLQLVNNREALASYVSKAFGMQLTPAQQAAVAAAAPTSGNPEELATLGETQSLLDQRLQPVLQLVQELQNSLSQRIDSTTADIEHRQQTAKHAVAIDSTLQQIFKENPVLTAIPNAEELIRFNVAKLNPQTEDEALQAFQQVSKGIVEEIGKHNKQVVKAQKLAQAKQKLETSSIEPAGGAPPQLQPSNFKNTDGSVNWNKVRDMASSVYGNRG